MVYPPARTNTYAHYTRDMTHCDKNANSNNPSSRALKNTSSEVDNVNECQTG